MILVQETQSMYEGLEMQKHIQRQTTLKNKQWVYHILCGTREQDRVIYTDPEKRFLLLPGMGDVREKSSGYIAIVADPLLKCLRDLRGHHVHFLQELRDKCMQHLPVHFDQCSIHYHPSVYQLHIHFRTKEDKSHNDLRVFMLDTVIENLLSDTLYYKTTCLTFSVPMTSDFVRYVGKSTRFQNDANNCTKKNNRCVRRFNQRPIVI